MGCVMMRVCNLDTCPMGICTQNPELRKRFKGKPEYVMNFMRFMAEDLREYMAKLGVRTVDELVGRTDLLKVKAAPAGSRAGEMDLTALLQNPLVENSNVHFNAKDVYNFQLEKTPDMRILMKKFKKSFDSAEPKPSTVTLDVGNTDRAFGTIIRQRDHRQVRQHAARRHVPCRLPRLRRPELRRVHPQGPDARAGRRRERLHRQGSVRRQAHRLPAEGRRL